MSIVSFFKSPQGFLQSTGVVHAYLYKKNTRKNLQTGEEESYPFSLFLTKMHREKKIKILSQVKVLHLFYEASFFFLDLKVQQEQLEAHVPLAIEIEYQNLVKMDLVKAVRKIEIEEVSTVSFASYKKMFEEVYAELLRGNAYQINLTCPFRYRYQADYCAMDFMRYVWNKKHLLGAYAHATWLKKEKLLFLSNSPENFFSLKINADSLSIASRPIKGTMPLSHSKQLPRVLKNLKNSQKNKNELTIITDLIRNDLSAIGHSQAKVLYPQKFLQVPALLHQYAYIESCINKRVSLKEILTHLFPAGSITGAPKKKVVMLIQSIEQGSRGFYCGATLLSFKNKIQASVNIRSAVIDLNKKEISCHAGGGITLLSKAPSEYAEMLLKKKSFMQLFGP
ncbi:MAG: chorismate-binding protein [Bacteriovoracaceae bacterium]|nr:chorismate-binding protein [Bacteriovoracaceae bacterium]